MHYPSPPWTIPPAELALSSHEIHLWMVTLLVSDFQQAHFQKMLSQDEWARSTRFQFQRHRERFIAGRGLLRQLLSRYLLLEPAKIQFCYNAFGKPSLDSAVHGQTALQFNLSHSQDFALFAFTRSGEIGIDIEQINPETNLQQAGAYVFSTPEIETMKALPIDQQRLAFFQYWTRKEAYIKGKGEGFAIPLRQCEVSQTPEKPVLQLNEQGEALGFTDWYLWDLPTLPGYAAAVAALGKERCFSFFHPLDSLFEAGCAEPK